MKDGWLYEGSRTYTRDRFMERILWLPADLARLRRLKGRGWYYHSVETTRGPFNTLAEAKRVAGARKP